MTAWQQSSLPATLDPPLDRAAYGPTMAEFHGQQGCGAMPGENDDHSFEVACTFGDRAAARSIVLVGDSEADMWLPTLDIWGQREHWRVIRLVKNACDPWDDHISYWPSCARWKQFVVKKINQLKVHAVVAVGMEIDLQAAPAHVTPARLASQIRRFQSDILASHSRLILLENIPWFYRNLSPLVCLAYHRADIRVCNHHPASSLLAPSMSMALRAVAMDKRVRFVNVKSLFCSPRACPEVVGSRVVYADTHHFTTQWAFFIAKAFSAHFDRALAT